MNDPTPNQSEHRRTRTEVIPAIRTTANPHERERPRHIRAMNGPRRGDQLDSAGASDRCHPALTGHSDGESFTADALGRASLPAYRAHGWRRALWQLEGG